MSLWVDCIQVLHTFTALTITIERAFHGFTSLFFVIGTMHALYGVLVVWISSRFLEPHNGQMLLIPYVDF